MQVSKKTLWMFVVLVQNAGIDSICKSSLLKVNVF